MNITFHPAFDSAAWPGNVSAQGAATFGEVWLGSMGFLELLESKLGLSGVYPSLAERAAALIPHLRKTPGYWRASFERSNPLGVALRLVEQRDFLVLHGWQREPLTERLQDLAVATEPVLPGPADRWWAVLQALAKLDIEAITLMCDARELPTLVQRCLETLAKTGVRIERTSPASTPARGDLAGARSPNFSPVGDGTLQLLRPFGATAAADGVGAWLAGQNLQGSVLIIGADGVLDRALHDYGLPTAGAHPDPGALGALLPLTLELAFAPQDPRRVHELSTLPGGPIPLEVGGALVHALQRWPSTESDAWREALASSLAVLDDVEHRDEIRRRAEIVFTPDVPPNGVHLTIEAAWRRLTFLETWALGSLEDAKESEPLRGLQRLLRHIHAFRRLVTAAGEQRLALPELRRWLEASAPAGEPRFVPRAGLFFVDEPAQVAGPAHTIIWWSFRADAVPSVRKLVHPTDARALSQAGYRLPSAAECAARVAGQWQMPLLLAQERLICVCPQRASDGERCFPHPLWDEITGRVPDTPGESSGKTSPGAARAGSPGVSSGALDALVVREPFGGQAPARQVAEPLSLPRATRRWQLPQGGRLRSERESPTSLEMLLGCSLQWALERFGHLEMNLCAPPPDVSPLVMGRVAHEIYDALFTRGMNLPDEAEVAAGELFDAMLPRLAAPFLLPGAEAQHGALRYRVVKGARLIATILHMSEARVFAHEHELALQIQDLEIVGRADLLLDHPPAVIDYKWGLGKRDEQLRTGTALQLAVYAKLFAKDRPSWPAVAYVILSKLDAYTNDAALEGATHVPGLSLEETWSALMAALQVRRRELSEGVMIAGAVSDEGEETPVDKRAIREGVLQVPAGCQYCTYGNLCGLTLGGGGG